MQITFLGGTDEIGASSIMIEVAGVRILVDAGLRPKSGSQDALPSLNRLPGPPDVVLITHSHIDHIGALPVVYKRFQPRRIYASEPTAALMKIMLLDSAYLQQLQPGEPLYNKDDVQQTIHNVTSLLMNRWYQLSAGIAMCLVPAGHLLGAVSVLLDTAEGRIVVSGDVSLTHQRAVPGFSAPPFKADVLILESTYGDSVHPPRIEEERRLVQSVTEVVTSGGIALVPSFALGRAQEVMLTLRQAQLANEIPAFPIYADGLVRAVTEVYHSQKRYLNPPLQAVEGHPFWKQNRVMKVLAGQRRRIVEKPACIVASSGMLFGGPSVYYASQIIEYPENAIFITGYTDEESPGRRLQQLAQGDTITLEHQEYQVGCQVRKFGLSGHADAEQLATLVRHFEPRDTFLVHGEANGRSGLKDRLPDHISVHLPMKEEQVNFAPPNWLFRRPPYLLSKSQPGRKKSRAIEDVAPLAGEVSETLPKLGIHHQKVIEGALVRSDIPSRFPCMTCGAEKEFTVDLTVRQINWDCPGCGRTYTENIMNLKQKDISKLSEREQELLADLIQVSIFLHEPTLDRDWLDLIVKADSWHHWLRTFRGPGGISATAPAKADTPAKATAAPAKESTKAEADDEEMVVIENELSDDEFDFEGDFDLEADSKRKNGDGGRDEDDDEDEDDDFFIDEIFFEEDESEEEEV